MRQRQCYFHKLAAPPHQSADRERGVGRGERGRFVRSTAAMAGDKGKGKRTSFPAEHHGEERSDKGKGKRTFVSAEHRGGDERGPKIRKVTQEEMGKRKGKLQIKERDKPMELEKTRRLEGKGRKLVPEAWQEKGKKAAAERWADLAKRLTEKQVAFYKTILEPDYGRVAFTEDIMAYYPGGPDRCRALNAFMREQVRDFKEHAAARIKEYEEKGCIEGFPETLIHPDSLNLLTGK